MLSTLESFISRAGAGLPDQPDNWPTNWIRLASVTLPTLFLAVVIGQPFIEPKWMFLDALTAAEQAPKCCTGYFGFVSTLGVMIWVATAAVLLFFGVLFLITGKNRQLTHFALSGGVLTGWLAIDDAYRVHENFLPSLGVPQDLVIIAYAVLAMIYVAASWRVILANDFWILIAGGGALAASIFIDMVFHSLASHFVLLEDGAKFFGIFCWMSFHTSTAMKYMASALAAGLDGRTEKI